MRFSIEQIFLTDGSGKPLGEKGRREYHVVDADTADVALSLLLDEQQANVIGDVLRFAGAQAVATAQQAGTVFTLHAAPGSGIFRRKPRTPAPEPESERPSTMR